MDVRSLAAALAMRFRGLDRAYGRYEIPDDAKADGRGKVKGEARTWRGEVTESLWIDHLKGNTGLGIVPITDRATAWFGAIDIDEYPLDINSLALRIRELKLPLIVCRTKSGGAHLYLFMSEEAPAGLVRSRLLEWAVILGRPRVEVFPKQVKLASENDDGSWINMPYFGGRRTTRYAVVPDGALDLKGFLEYADQLQISKLDLETYESPKIAGDWFDDGPPCLAALSQNGFPEGTRNGGLFNICVFLKKKYPEDWEKQIDRYNQEFMTPPLTSGEMQIIIKSVKKKDYGYRCKDEPICGACNRSVCLTKKHGVGAEQGDAGVVFGPIVKLDTDPPTWIWDVDGARLELSTSELMDQRRFHAVAIDKLNKWPRLIKPDAWKTMIAERLKGVTVIEVPDDATREGQLWVHLSRFCTSRVAGKNLDDLLLARPFTKDGRTYFCGADFIDYLKGHRFGALTEKQLYSFLRRRGVEHHFNRIKGKGVNYWSVPGFEQQTEEFETPREMVKEAM